MDVKQVRLVPYPKRLKTLIVDYQNQKNAKDFHKILELIDKLLIKIIQRIYKFESYSYLKKYEPNEIYHTAIIALEKVICQIKVDENFSIKKLSSYLNGYIGREFKITFLNGTRYVELDSIGEDEFSFVHDKRTGLSEESTIESVGYVDCDFPKEAVQILKKNIVDKMSLQEIADEMGVKKGYVRYWVNRGKKILKRVIERERKDGLWHS